MGGVPALPSALLPTAARSGADAAPPQGALVTSDWSEMETLEERHRNFACMLLVLTLVLGAVTVAVDALTGAL